MEIINGITFMDFAVVKAYLERGRALEELLSLLGVEKHLWDEASDYWQICVDNDVTFELASLMQEISQDPARGKFADFDAGSNRIMG